MKKFLFFVSVSALSIVFLSSCTREVITGSGPVVTETRTVAGFTGVSHKVPGRVNFKIGPEFKVEVTGQKNVLDVMYTDIISGSLTIGFRNNIRVREHDQIIIDITAPTADYFSLSGTGDINVQGDLNTSSLYLTVSGVGNIYVQKANILGELKAKISGSGDIRVATGTALDEDLRISGSGNIDFLDVVAARAETHTSGSGSMKVNVSQRLESYISGSGWVYYKGNPVVVKSISGSGQVRPY